MREIAAQNLGSILKTFVAFFKIYKVAYTFKLIFRQIPTFFYIIKWYPGLTFAIAKISRKFAHKSKRVGKKRTFLANVIEGLAINSVLSFLKFFLREFKIFNAKKNIIKNIVF